MTTKHRGAHPHDPELFAPDQAPLLRRAVADLGWLLDRSYTPKASLKLVGDRYALQRRQRIAVNRCACGPVALEARLALRQPATALAGATVHLDGLNILTSLEAALGGGVLLKGADGVIRDMAPQGAPVRARRGPRATVARGARPRPRRRPHRATAFLQVERPFVLFLPNRPCGGLVPRRDG